MHAVLKHFHPMIGCDFHILMPPGSPLPGPPVPHLSMSSLMGWGITADMGPMEFSHFGWTIMRGSDIGPLIPHAGPPNCLLPVILLTSASKSHFGSSQCLIKNKPVAVALLLVVNPNLNCGDPIPAPLDGVLAITGHFVGMTLGDIISGVIHVVCDIGLQFLINKLCGKLFDKIGKKIYEKVLFAPMFALFGKMGYGPVTTWLLKNDLQEMIAKGFAVKLISMIGSDFVGAPLGYSFPVNGLGFLDSLGKSDGQPGAMESAHTAVQEFIDGPVETHDVAPAAPSARPEPSASFPPDGATDGSEAGQSSTPETSPDGGASGTSGSPASDAGEGGAGGAIDAGGAGAGPPDGTNQTPVNQTPDGRGGMSLPDGTEDPGTGSDR
jgi:hypothetical protein